ncbi:Uncharacterised protein [Mycobacteroides abscessus subsp. abscessus]|nr:Uncharacterised protein [Mycobacteroides abscessus subsp. abscessus]
MSTSLNGGRSPTATCSSAPRGRDGCAAAFGQNHPSPAASCAAASGVPNTTASAPQAIDLARSPEVWMSPSANTCTYRPPVSSRYSRRAAAASAMAVAMATLTPSTSPLVVAPAVCPYPTMTPAAPVRIRCKAVR